MPNPRQHVFALGNPFLAPAQDDVNRSGTFIAFPALRHCQRPDHERPVIAPPFPDLLIERRIAYPARLQFSGDGFPDFFKLQHLQTREKH
ncbi:hypothetical protein EP837_03198 [Sphingobium sp. EP60837]|nr:hypothetical protein EP837_03198 [Sphingobium sp. EP60837]